MGLTAPTTEVHGCSCTSVSAWGACARARSQVGQVGFSMMPNDRWQWRELVGEWVIDLQGTTLPASSHEVAAGRGSCSWLHARLGDHGMERCVAYGTRACVTLLPVAWVVLAGESGWHVKAASFEKLAARIQAWYLC